MRIHRLALAGIGPYATPQEIDLDELSRGGLFLLTGPTGAGKTTILDAIVYALYGTVPGVRGARSRGDKGTSDRIVSDLRQPESQPYVELECTVAGRRIAIRRVPQHLRPKARGEGLTTEKSSVLLREQIDGDWVARSTDPQEVGSTVKELLGMSAAQFAQVVLLPQGEFAGFLRADDKERRGVLERLFRVDEYHEAQAWFEGRAREAREQLQTAEADLRGAVDRLRGALGASAGSPPEELSLDAIEQWTADCRFAADELAQLARVDVETAAAARARASAALRQTEHLLAATREREARADVVAGLNARLVGARTWIAAHESASLADDPERWAPVAREARTQLARIDERADDAARAAALRDQARVDDERAVRAEQEVAATAARITELSAALPIAQEAATSATIAEETVAALTRERDTIAARLAAVTQLGALSARRVDLIGACEALQAAAAEASAAAAAAGRLDALEATARDAEAQLGVLEVQLAETTAATQQAAEQVANLTAARDRAVSLTGALGDALVRRDAARAAWLEARDSSLSAREARLDAMAAELAESLQSDEPCPVCGSTEHPAPAQPTPGTDLRRAEEHAQTAAEAASKVVDARAAEVATLEGQLATVGRPEALAESLDAAQRSAHEAQRQRDDAAAAVASQRTVVHAARAALERARGLEQQAVERERAHQAARQELALLDAELDAVAAAAGPDPLTADDLARADDELRRLRTRQAEAAGARERVAAIERDLAAARSNADHLRAAAARHASKARAARDQAVALTERLSTLIAPHPTLDDARHAAARRCETLELAASIHRDAAAAGQELDAATRAAELAHQEEAPRADEPADPAERLTARATTCEGADLAHERAAAALREAERHLRAIDTAEQELQAVRAVLGPAAEEADRLRRLDETIRGLGDNRRRISLTTYVLAARLEEVAVAATAHLERMSSGRYALIHHDERYGNGPAGLGLRVVDAHSGEERDTATLSGGEAFYASLALALGLADVVQAESGGRALETLLVDEGFGALDPDTLEEVLGELDELRAAGRAIGLVSHVPALAERIPAQLRVSASPAGSTARVVIGDVAAI